VVKLLPARDGKHAWMWRTDGVHLIDINGDVVGHPGASPVLEDFIPGSAAERRPVAWAIGQGDHQLYVINDEGGWSPAHAVDAPAVSAGQVKHAWGTGLAWVLTTASPPTLYRVATDGNAVQALAGKEVAEDFQPGAGCAWARARQPGDVSYQLFQIPVSGAPTARVSQLENEDTFYLPDPDPKGLPAGAAWVTSKRRKALWRVGVTGPAVPVDGWPADREIQLVQPDANGAWVVANGNTELSYVDAADPAHLRLVAVTPAGKKILLVVPTATPGKAWVQYEDDSRLAVVSARPASQFPVAFDAKVLLVIAAGDGAHAWAVVEGKGIFLIDDKGSPAGKRFDWCEGLRDAPRPAAPGGKCLWVADKRGGVHRVRAEADAPAVTYRPAEKFFRLDSASDDGRQVWGVPLDNCGAVLIDAAADAEWNVAGHGVWNSAEFSGDNRRGWLCAGSHLFTFGPALPSELDVVLGETRLPPPGKGPPAVRRSFPTVRITAAGAGHPPLATKNATLKLFASAQPPPGQEQAEPRKILVAQSFNYEQEGDDGTTVVLKRTDWKPKAGQKYLLVLEHNDNEWGAQIEAAWPDVTFTEDWYHNPSVLAVGVYLAALLMAGLLALGLRPLPQPARWGPVVPLLGTSVVPFALDHWAALDLNVNLLAVLVGVTVVVGLGYGLLNPPFLGLLARNCAPIDILVARLVARHAWFRRRQFAPYVRELREKTLVRWKKSCFDEVYVTLPARIRGGPDAACADPATEIARRLAKERRGALLVGAGGCGKTALLREVVEQTLRRFQEDGSAPLPVLVQKSLDNDDGPGTRAAAAKADPSPVEEVLRKRLSEYLLSDRQFADGLQAGDFVAVFDGVSEVAGAGALFETFLEEGNNRATPLLLSARWAGEGADSEFAGLMMKGRPEGLVVECLPLDEGTLPQFEGRYLDIDEEIRRSDDKHRDEWAPARLSPAMKEACRVGTTSNAYLPLLVRLAVRVGAREGGVREIYDKTLVKLIGSADDPQIDWLERLCVDTFWKNPKRDRLIPFRNATEEQREKLRRLLDRSLLIRDGFSPVNNDPDNVRFFHDTMQSYLTACGLAKGFAGEGPAVDPWAVLFRAAGHPEFSMDRSEIAGVAGSELFQMCLHVLSPPRAPGAACQVLRRHMRAWAEVSDFCALGKGAVLAACPDDPGPAPEARAVKDDLSATTGDMIRKVIALYGHGNEESARALRNLSVLYGNLAGVIWRNVDRPDEKLVSHPAQPPAGPTRNAREPAAAP
jgi:hypothetical protein